MTGLRTLIVAVCSAAAPALGIAVAAPPAPAAVIGSTSSNWAGYAAVSSASVRFRRVTASWIAPAADCSSSRRASSAFWIGLGGYSRTSRALEQAGTEADCSASGGASYRTWYELVPAAPVNARLAIAPGDAITATVTVSGRNVSLRIANGTRGTVFARRVRMRSPDLTSAEWVAEAPSLCDAAGACRTLPLTDFGEVGFSGASATTTAGRTGTIADAAWSTVRITLGDTFAGSGPARFAGAISAAGADPGALLGGGSAFGVTWRRLQVGAGPGPAGLGPGGG